MTTREFYTPVSAKQVKSFIHTELQGVKTIPDCTGLSPKDIESLSVFAVPTGTKDNSPENSQLVQINEQHARSYEIVLDKPEGVFWQDEYGNLFGSLTIKGNNLTNPHIFEQDNLPNGIAFYGLQDSTCMLRILKASDILRKNGVETEMIVAVLEPLEYPVEDGPLSPEQFKNKMFRNYWEETLESEDSEDGNNSSKMQSLLEVSKSLDRTALMITLRAMQAPERLENLNAVGTFDEYFKIMRRVCSFTNFKERERAKKDPGYVPSFFNIEELDDLDLENYVTEYLPTEIGTNLAKIHNLGLIHKYPTGGNISITGGFYDLDSVQGPLIDPNDPPLTDEDFWRDVSQTESSMHDIPGDPLWVYTRLASFRMAYAKNRGWEDNIAQNLFQIKRLYRDTFSRSEMRSTVNHYIALLENQLGIRYSDFADPIALKGGWEPFLQNIWQQNLKLLDKQESPRSKVNTAFTTEADLRRLLERNTIAHTLSLLGEKDPEISDETAEIIAELFVAKSIWEIWTNIPLPDRRLIEKEKDFYKDAIKKASIEGDVLSHMQAIFDLFDYFSSFEEDEYLAYYSRLVSEQTGINFRLPIDIPTLIKQAHDDDRQKMEKQLNENSRYSEMEPEAILKDLQEHIYPKGRDRFKNYTLDFLSAFFNEQFESQINELRTRFPDSETADQVEFLIVSAEFTRITALISEEEYAQIDSISAKNIDEAIKNYCINSTKSE